MGLSYSVTIPQLPALQRAYQEAPEVTKREVTVALNKSLVAYQATAKMLAPIDSGVLRGSILLQPAQWSGSSVQGSVGTNTQYAEAQEAGTGIYGPKKRPITPKTKTMLAWYAGGKWHFAKQVKGSRPRWYMRGSVERNQRGTEQRFAQALENVANHLGRAA